MVRLLGMFTFLLQFSDNTLTGR